MPASPPTSSTRSSSSAGRRSADAKALAVYDYAVELTANGHVRQSTYDAVLKDWGALGIVELTALIGYYTMVAMTLNAHQIPLPDGVAPPLPEPTLIGRISI